MSLHSTKDSEDYIINIRKTGPQNPLLLKRFTADYISLSSSPKPFLLPRCARNRLGDEERELTGVSAAAAFLSFLNTVPAAAAEPPDKTTHRTRSTRSRLEWWS